MAQTLKFGNGTWATKEGSTLAYNDENNNYKPLPFTTTRDSIATRVNKEGLIEVVGNDVPRIDYTDSADGVLLLEPSKANLITYSQDFSQWTKQSGGTGSVPIITSNDTISPDGTQNADKVVFDKGTSYTTADLSILSTSFTSQSNTASIYIKADSPQRIVIRNSSTWVGYDIGTEWTRIEKTDTGGSLQIGLRDGYGIADVPSTATVYLWGAQVEQGSYPTSYIPTSGSTVQRAADTATGAGNSEVFNDSQGVLYLNIAALVNSDTPRAISISDGTLANRVYIYYSTNNNIEAAIKVSGTDQAAFTANLTDSTLFNKIAIKYKENDFAIWVNGIEVDSDLSGSIFNANTLTELAFDLGDGSNDLYGKTKELGYYDEILTDEELEYLTSYRSLNELVTELNLNEL